jgi:hypothetical protein
MKIKCPVALCGWEGNTYDFWKHIEDYKITWKDVMDSGFPREESHERWANYFFPKIWNNPDLPEKNKWTNIAVAYVNQMKNLNRMAQHKGKKLSPDGSDRIEMHDGRITMNGKEYTPEEFQKIMPGIRVPQDNHPHLVRDITGELRIDGMTVEEYRKLHEQEIGRRIKRQ